MANPIPEIRLRQLLCRPNGCNYAKTAEEAMLPHFMFTKAETAAVNLAFRLNKGAEISSAQQAVVNRVQELASGIWGFRINGLRLLIANLVLIEPEVISAEKSLIKIKDIQNQWNAHLMDLYCSVEESHYHSSDGLSEDIKPSIDGMNALLAQIEKDVLRNKRERKAFSDDVRLLKEAFENMDNLFPCLLLPVSESLDFEISEKKFNLYQKLLHVGVDAFQMYYDDSKTFLRKTKHSVLRDQFLDGLNEWNHFLLSLKTPLKKVMSLQERLKTGDQKALFDLKEILKTYDFPNYHAVHSRLLVPSIRAMRVLTKREPGFSKTVALFDHTYLHITELIGRFTYILFNPLVGEINRCTVFVEALLPRMDLRSAHLTPLDLFRSWWSAPYLDGSLDPEETSKCLAAIELICQTLYNPNQNIDGKALIQVSLILQIMKSVAAAHASHEPIALLEALNQGHSLSILLPWLNAPLLQQDSKGEEKNALLVFMQQLHCYLDNCTMQMIRSTELTGQGGCVIVSGVVSEIMRLKKILSALLTENAFELEEFNRFCIETHSLARNFHFDDFLNHFDGKLREDVRKALESDLGILEDLRNLYVRPFLSIGRELLLSDQDTKHVKKAKTFRRSFTPAKPGTHSSEIANKKSVEIKLLQMGEIFESLIPRASEDLKKALSVLVESLKEPYLLEPIYFAAARCLEAHLKPTENHDLASCTTDPIDQQWLAKMQKFLPVNFSLPEIFEEDFEEDLCTTARMLGLEINRYQVLQKMSIPEANLAALDELQETLWNLKLQAPLKSCLKLSEESRFQFNCRKGFSYAILDALPVYLEDIGSLLALCEEKACSPILLKFLMMKVGQLMEGSLKMHLFHEAIPTNEKPEQHICFTMEGNRPRMYDHDLVRTHHLVAKKVFLNADEKRLLNRWRHFAHWTRYLHESTDPIADFLRQAELLYQDFHSDLDMEKLKWMGYEGEYREILHQLQKESLIPEIKQLLAISQRLLSAFLS